MCEFYEKICAGPRVFGHSELFVGRAVFKHPECTGCTESNFQNRCKNGYLCRIGGVSNKILGIITLKIDLEESDSNNNLRKTKIFGASPLRTRRFEFFRVPVTRKPVSTLLKDTPRQTRNCHH